MKKKMHEVPLSEFIDHIREELFSPDQTKKSEHIMYIDEVELELTVTVDSKNGGQGKLNVFIGEIGGGSEKADQQAQRIKLKMTPLLSKEEVKQIILKQDTELEKRTAKALTKGK